MITYDGYNLQFSMVTNHSGSLYAINYNEVIIHKKNYSIKINVREYIDTNDIIIHEFTDNNIIFLQKMEQMHKDGMSWENIKTYYEL